ncbi:MAG: hypothetical protein WCC77_19650 [Pseudolabrys sp.]
MNLIVGVMTFSKGRPEVRATSIATLIAASVQPSLLGGRASARLSIQEKCLQEKQSELSEHLETGVSFGIELRFDAMPFAKIREKICLPKIFMAL